MNKNFSHLCFKNGCNIPSISEPIIKKHGIYNLTGTYFPPPFWYSNPAALFSLCHVFASFFQYKFYLSHTNFGDVVENEGKIQPYSRCRFKTVNTFATLPGSSQYSSKKFISASRLKRNAKDFINTVLYARQNEESCSVNRDMSKVLLSTVFWPEINMTLDLRLVENMKSWSYFRLDLVCNC